MFGAGTCVNMASFTIVLLKVWTTILIGFIVEASLSDVPNELPCRNTTSNGYRGFCSKRSCCSGKQSPEDFREGLCPGQDPREVVCCYSKDVCLGAKSACEALNTVMVRRNEWQAVPINVAIRNLPKPVKYIIIHDTPSPGPDCTGVHSCSRMVRAIQRRHLDQGSADVKYSFIIAQDSLVYEGRGWDHASEHGDNYDDIAFSVTFLGQYDFVQPTADMVSSFERLRDCAIEKGYLTDSFTIHGHRDAFCVNCPHKFLYSFIKAYPNYGSKLPNYSCGYTNNSNRRRLRKSLQHIQSQSRP